jgi:hypothetical protein
MTDPGAAALACFVLGVVAGAYAMWLALLPRKPRP